MKKGVRWMAVIVLLLLLAGIGAIMIVRAQSTFTGSRVRNPDCYDLDIKRMQGNDEWNMTFSEGDVLDVSFDIRKGRMDLYILDGDGEMIYQGNRIETASFELVIPHDGCYTVRVEAKQAAGALRVALKDCR